MEYEEPNLTTTTNLFLKWVAKKNHHLLVKTPPTSNSKTKKIHICILLPLPKKMTKKSTYVYELYTVHGMSYVYSTGTSKIRVTGTPNICLGNQPTSRCRPLEEPPQLPPELAILQRPAERIAPHQRWQFVKGKWLGIFTLKVAGSSKSHSL